MGPRETIFVVDDDESICRSLARLFASEGCAVETFPGPAPFLAEPDLERASCLVLDLRLPGRCGLSIQEELARRGCVLPIVFISGYGDVVATVQAMKGGAVDFLPKPYDEGALIAAVSRAAERGRAERARRDKLRAARARCAALTARELEVAQRVTAGLLNKQIAAELGTAEKTVAVQRASAMKKLGVESVAEMVRLLDRALVEGEAARAG